MLCLLGLIASASVLAVPHVEDHTQRFSPTQLEQWRTQLTARIVSSKKYRVAAAENVRELLASIKKRSFDPSFDDQRRVDVGRELPAQKVLDVQLFNSGASCALIAALYDLERAVAYEAHSRTTDCTEDQLQRGFDEVASAITGESIEDLIPERRPPSEPWRVSSELLLLGLGYGGTTGGATGPIAAAELFSLRYGPLRATLIDAGATLYASKGEDLFEQTDHALFYVGATAGVGFDFGENDRHELRLSGGPALYHAEAEADFFTGQKLHADETGGLIPAAIADARYTFQVIDVSELDLGFGGGFRAVIPLEQAARGDPTLVMMRLFLTFGAL